MLKSELRQCLDRFGWTEVAGLVNDEGVVTLAQQLGPITHQQGRAVARLFPMTSDQVKSRSFSFHFGHREFPLHTDTAFLPTPVRYLILKGECRSETPTLLLGAQLLKEVFDTKDARRAIFAVRTIRSTIYSSPYLDAGHQGVRFDPCYMTPSNKYANSLARLIVDASREATVFKWTGDNALIIDNWRCLHGRGALHHDDATRCLSRIYIGG